MNGSRHPVDDFRDAGEDIPEMTPASRKFFAVRNVALAVCVLAVLACLSLAAGNDFNLHADDVTSGVGAFVACVFVALTAGFVWVYTGFALSLKSRDRGK